MTAMLGRRRALMRASLWAEQLGPALSRPAALLALAACAVLLGGADLLPFWPHVLVLAALAAATAALTARGLRAIRRPTAWQVDRRLEAGGGVPHQPLLALSDSPAAAPDDGGGNLLWTAHLGRQRAAAARVKATWPRPLLSAADPRALRAALLLSLVACAVVAGPDAGPRLLHAVRPQPPAAVPAPVAAAQAWITPPAYTGQPPTVLAGGQRDFSALAGTQLVVTVTNVPGGAPVLTVPSGPVAATALGTGSWQAAATLTESGTVAVLRDNQPLQAWRATISAPSAPEVAWAEPPGPAPQDEADTAPPVRLPWDVRDAYGVRALRAELRLVARPDLPPLMIPLTLPATNPRAARGAATPDLTAHPFAGLPVAATLAAENGVPLSAVSEPAAFTLPERAFRNPAARALIAARRMLTLRPEDRRGPAEEIDAVARGADRPADAASLLELGALPSLLLADRSDAAIAQAQSRLWALALRLEDATQQTAEALDAARKDAADALEDAQSAAQKQASKDADGDPAKDGQPDRATPAEREALDRKLEDLRRALDEHVQALDERRAAEGRPDPASKETERQAKRDADAARDAARKQDLPRTREKLADLDRQLQALRQRDAGRDPDAADAKRKQAARRRGQQQLNVVQDMVQRQTAMVDQADRRARGPARTGPTAGASPPERAARDAAERQGDGRTQQALRRALGELLQQSGDLTGEVPKGLTDADQAMRDSAAALDRAADPQARQAGERAVASLQEGSRELANTLRQKFGKGSKPGDQAGDQGKGSKPGDQGEDGDGGDGQGDGQGDDDMALDGDGQGEGEGQDGQAPGGKSAGGTGRGEKRDPFGRALTDGGHGMDDGGNVRVPTEMERARARDLRGELRRREADRTRPLPERTYIERLLEGTE